MWNLTSLSRDGTHTPCTGRRSLNHWTAREVPKASSGGTLISSCLGEKLLEYLVYRRDLGPGGA